MSNFVTKSEIPEPDNIVTTNTEQTIYADKTIKGTFRIARADNSTAFCLYNNQTDNIAFAGFKYVGNKSIGTRYSLPIYDTETSKIIATTDQIPNVSNMATTDTEQTISAKKTFTNELRSESYIHIQDNSDGRYLQLYADKIAWKDNQGQLRDNSLPGGDGQLATVDDITYLAVTKNGDQTITGKKTFQTTVTAPNLTAQGTNQSTVYGGAQIVHTFDDNTTLNLKYPKKKGNQTIATVGDIPNVSNLVTLDTAQTITANKKIEGTLDVQGNLSIVRANGKAAVRIYNDQPNQIGIAGWKEVDGKNVRTWYSFPTYDTQTSKTIATTDDIKTYYTHCITFKSANNDTCGTTIIRNTSNTAFTADTLKTWLYDNGFRDLPSNTTNGIYMASGAVYYNNNNIPIIGLRSDNKKIIGVAQKSSNGFQQPTITNVVDIVI